MVNFSTSQIRFENEQKKVHPMNESALRRKAKRFGYRLHKDRDGYTIVDIYDNTVAHGPGLTLEEVNAWLLWRAGLEG